jgi:NAD(P)H-flavin reductase
LGAFLNEPVPLPVASCRQVAARHVLLTLTAAGTSVAGSYTVPGQYARMTLDDGVARPYALASAPHDEHFEFLLKLPPERIAPMTALGGPGGERDRVLVTKAQGRGFPLDEARGRALWLFAVGSGIAPLRAVIEHVLPRRQDFGDVTLLYGARRKEELCFTERFAVWAGHGVAVWPVVSQADIPPETATWDGRTGWIQHHVPKAFDDPGDVVAFVCGLPEMDKAVQAALLERGVGPDRVFRNY